MNGFERVWKCLVFSFIECATVHTPRLNNPPLIYVCGDRVAIRTPALFNPCDDSSYGRDGPPRRHLAEPFDAGRLHGGVGVEAFGDGVGDDGLAFFFQQFHQPPLLRHQPINLPRLPVQKLRNGRLLGERWETSEACSYIAKRDRLPHTCPKRLHVGYIKQMKLIFEVVFVGFRFGSKDDVGGAHAGVYV